MSDAPGRVSSSTTPVLDLMESTIGGTMVLRTSPREIAEAVLLALEASGFHACAYDTRSRFEGF